MNLLAYLHAKDGRTGRVQVAGLDERAHVLVEERHKQDANVSTVDIGIAHDDDLVVARLGQVEVAALTGGVGDAGTDGRDERLNGLAGESAVVANTLDVQNLAAQGKNCLDVSATAVLGRAACRVTLDNEEFGHGRLAHGAVSKLTGQARALKQALATRGLAGLTRGGAGLAGRNRLVADGAGLVGVLLEVLLESGGHSLLREVAHEGAAELCLGLALELRVGKLDRDDGRKALAGIIAREVLVLILENALLARIVVDGARQSGAEALEMRAAVDGVDVVREGHDLGAIPGIPLNGDLDLAALVVGHVLGRLALHVDGLGQARENLVAFVQELDEVIDTTLVAVLLNARGKLTLVGEDDLEAAVEEVSWKISGSGQKVTLVPVVFVLPMTSICFVVLPRENSIA